MTKSYIIYACVRDKETLLAVASNLRDVLAVGSARLNEALTSGFTKPEFKLQSCEINGTEVIINTLPLDIQVGSKIVVKNT